MGSLHVPDAPLFNLRAYIMLSCEPCHFRVDVSLRKSTEIVVCGCPTESTSSFWVGTTLAQVNLQRYTLRHDLCNLCLLSLYIR